MFGTHVNMELWQGHGPIDKGQLHIYSKETLKYLVPVVRGWLGSASEADLSNMFEDNDVLLVALTLTVATVCRPIN